MLPPTPTQLYLVSIKFRRKISFVTSFTISDWSTYKVLFQAIKNLIVVNSIFYCLKLFLGFLTFKNEKDLEKTAMLFSFCLLSFCDKHWFKSLKRT